MSDEKPQWVKTFGRICGSIMVGCLTVSVIAGTIYLVKLAF